MSGGKVEVHRATHKARTADDNPDAVFLSGDFTEAVATGLEPPPPPPGPETGGTPPSQPSTSRPPV